MGIEEQYQLYTERFWYRNWMEIYSFLSKLSDDLSEEMKKNSDSYYTFIGVQKILTFVDTLTGFGMADSFEYELEELECVFNSKNLKYRHFLRCRHIHNVVRKELLEHVNPQLEFDSTARFEIIQLHLLVQIMLQFPRMWGDPWTPDWKRKK